MSWDHASPYIHQVTVLPEHIDALEHTNNTQYVNWCNQAAWAHTTDLGLGADAYRELDRALALTKAEYHYLRATRLGDVLDVGTWITSWNRKLVMERKMQIRSVATGDTVLRARLSFVCIAISTGKPKRPPAEFIARYTPALVD